MELDKTFASSLGKQAASRCDIQRVVLRSTRRQEGGGGGRFGADSMKFGLSLQRQIGQSFNKNTTT